MSQPVTNCRCFLEEDDWFALRTCGCGANHLRPFRDVVYHYAGTHWRPHCLIEYLLDRISD